MEIKNLKPFNIEKAKAGAELVTRNGRPARVICTDRNGSDYQVVALVKGPDNCEDIMCYFANGFSSIRTECDSDLFIVPTKHTAYGCIFRNKGGMIQSLLFKSEAKRTKYMETLPYEVLKVYEVEYEE